MYRLKLKNGLLYADITLVHENDIGFDNSDELVVMSGIGGAEASAVRKRIDSISMGDISLQDIIIDFGVVDPKDRINGLIGLDFLRAAKIVIDLDALAVYKKSA